MLIKNKTLYDKDLIVKYNNYFIASYLKKNFIVMSIITLVFIGYMLSIQNYLFAAVLLGILVLYLVLTYFMQKVSTNRLLSKSPLVEQPVLQVYEFSDDEYSVTNIRTSNASYDTIKKMNKSKDFYILVTTDNRRLIVSFAGFEFINEQTVFEEFMKEKLNKKKSK